MATIQTLYLGDLRPKSRTSSPVTGLSLTLRPTTTAKANTSLRRTWLLQLWEVVC